MRKFLLFAFTVIMAATTNAQSALELAKQQKELNAINRDLLNEKPSKDAKKQAKTLKKEGWKVPAGNLSIEQQLTKSQLLGEELMSGDDGSAVKRYIMHTGQQTSGSYNTGYAAARASALAEIASMISTEIVGALKLKQDNDQLSTVNSETNDKFNQRIKAVVAQSLTNVLPCLAIYRDLPNNNIQVQVRIAYDKKELKKRLKQNLKKSMEADGDELESIVDEILNKKF